MGIYLALETRTYKPTFKVDVQFESTKCYAVNIFKMINGYNNQTGTSLTAVLVGRNKVTQRRITSNTVAQHYLFHFFSRLDKA